MRRNGRKGNVIVETAVVSLVFFLLVFGIFDFGQFLFVHQALVHRIRHAVRAGAISDASDHTAIINRILYDQSTAKTDANGNAAKGYFGLTSSNITVADPEKNTDSYRLNVEVKNFPFIMLSPYMAGSKLSSGSIKVTVPLGLFN